VRRHRRVDCGAPVVTAWIDRFIAEDGKAQIEPANSEKIAKSLRGKIERSPVIFHG
jgi:hypothetical protein